MIRPRSLLLPLAAALLALLLSAAAQDRLQMYGGGTFTLGEDVSFYVYLSGRPTADLTLYRIDDPETVFQLGGPRDFVDSDELDLTVVETVRVEPSNGLYGSEVVFSDLPLGLYLAQVEDAAATMALVTDLAMVVKTDVDTLLSYTAQAESGEPRAAEVFLLRDGAVHASGSADRDGIAEFPLEGAGERDVAAAASFEGSWAFSDAYWSRWNLEPYRIHVHTDRSIYRPDQTVYFKGTARRGGSLSPAADAEVEVVIRDADYVEVSRQSLPTDEYGSFHAEFEIGSVPPLGRWHLEVTLEGHTVYGGFQVQEYRKPEYRVAVEPEQEALVQGESAVVTISAEYLFGGAVGGAEVEYAILVQDYSRFRYRSRFGFYQEVDYSFGGDLLERGEAVLDQDGRLELEIPLPREERDYRLLVQAGVTDEARNEVRGSGSLVAYRANAVLGLDTDRYAYRSDEQARVTVSAEDIQGERIDLPVTVEVHRIDWLADGERRRSLWRTLEGNTGDDGTATFILDFEDQGVYELRASASDEQGRRTSVGASTWVSDGSYWWGNYGSLAVEPDKPEYEVGETARFVITSPVADAYALITREGRELHTAELVRLEGSLLTYELPITRGMAPNGYLSVAVIAGGETYTASTGFRVPPADAFLNVELTSDSDRYQPGDRGEFTVRVSDPEGNGVRAQLSLALVDEAIFELSEDSTPDVRAFFHALHANAVGTDFSSNSYFGGVRPLSVGGAPPAPMDEAVFGQGKSAFAEAEEREDFRDTILWLPELETDGEGIARASVVFPDNLTEWRLTARAVTLGQGVGQNSYNVVTTLPVIARLAAPRFLVRGDSVSLRVIGQNNLNSELQGRLELAADGLSLIGAGARSVTISEGDRAQADFEARAETSGTAQLTARALTSAASDSLRIPLPVVPHGVREALSWAGSGDDGWDFFLPAGTDPATFRGELLLTPSLAAAVSPALGFLAGFPYGCTEQTMSRFLPSLLAVRAGELARLPNEVAERLDDYVIGGISRLYDFQHDDGGWGFWQFDVSSPFISAYVVSGLLEAREAGYRVYDWVLERGLSYLEQAVTKDGFEVHRGGDPQLQRTADVDAKAYAYLALARAGREIEGLARVAGDPSISPYGLALSVLALESAGRTVEANLYLDELLGRAVERESVAYWQPRAPRFAWNDDRIETTAYALQALALLRPDDPIVAKVVNWLLLERRGAAWVSTKDTAAVIQAALALEESAGDDDARASVEVSLDGDVLGLHEFAGADAGIGVPLPEISSGWHRLELQSDGPGNIYAGAMVEFVADRDPLEPSSQGIVVSRTYRALTPRLVEEENRYLYDPSPVEEIEVGDYLLVSVELAPQDDLRYLLVNEPLPAGFEVIENDLAFPVVGSEPRYGRDYFGWNRWYDGRDVRDQRIDFYFARLAEPVTFTYILRAQTPGSFTALPSQAWLMYAPEVRGNGAPERLIVRPERP